MMRPCTWMLGALLLCCAVTAPAGADDDADRPLPRNLTQEELLDKYATPQSSFAYLNRTLLHYREDGEGPAVLLIHGSVQDLYDWDPWAKGLSSKYRVIRFDMPAAGLTGRVQPGDYSIANTMRTIDELMDRLGEERFAVVGTSLGGIVAFRYAATRRDRTAALVLMNSAGVAWGNEKIIPPQKRRYDDSLSETISKATVQTMIEAIIPDSADIPDRRVQRTLDYQRREGRHLEAAALVSAYDRGEPADMLGKITAPTLVLWGRDNQALDTGVADEFVRLLDCARVAEKALIPRAGHWPHVEAPERSLAFVERFFSQYYRPDFHDTPENCG
ncbi:MAG: alpha/beta hydrolase [Chromatocurvus sp.]